MYLPYIRKSKEIVSAVHRNDRDDNFILKKHIYGLPHKP
ncbi:hypothetical protein CHCC20375_3640 [Bacillus licheniformis]|nr:hypothetical protein CHCC20375_3640 [Bacillus licheniformis]